MNRARSRRRGAAGSSAVAGALSSAAVFAVTVASSGRVMGWLGATEGWGAAGDWTGGAARAAVGVGELIGESKRGSVGAGTGVLVGSAAGVSVGGAVGVSVGNATAVAVGVEVSVGVPVGVGVSVNTGVQVNVGVGVHVGVCKGVTMVDVGVTVSCNNRPAQATGPRPARAMLSSSMPTSSIGLEYRKERFVARRCFSTGLPF